MNKPTPLDTLTGLAREARDNAARLLAGERRNQQQLAQQADTLHHYREEYRQRMQQVMAEGIDMTTLGNYQRFLSSLDNAIEQVQSAMGNQQRKVEHCQQQWQGQQQRLSAYDTLSARRLAAIRRSELRREQHQNDEFGNQAHRRRQQASGTKTP